MKFSKVKPEPTRKLVAVIGCCGAGIYTEHDGMVSYTFVGGGDNYPVETIENPSGYPDLKTLYEQSSEGRTPVYEGEQVILQF